LFHSCYICKENNYSGSKFRRDTHMIAQEKKTNYFYIDEAGHVNNDSKIFIHGCIKTDTPESLENSIRNLKKEIIDDLYFSFIREKFIAQGFHAVGNHPDIRAKFYSILPLLNFRSYFVIVDKTTSYYETIKENRKPFEIFQLTLYKLLRDRIIKNNHEKNVFYFENIEFAELALNEILKSFFVQFKGIDCQYYIVDKKFETLSIIDYLNYIFFCLFDTKTFPERMKENFELVKPKIGSVYFLNKDIYLSRHNLINLNKIQILFGG